MKAKLLARLFTGASGFLGDEVHCTGLLAYACPLLVYPARP